MKKIFAPLVFFISITSLFAQKQTFDLVTYSTPAAWKKEVNETITSYTVTDKKKNIWCRIAVIKSTISKGGIEPDFESEWQELVAIPYKITDAAQTKKVQEKDGWKIKAGTGKFIFDKKEAIAILSTMSGYERCASIMAITNSQDYLPQIQSFLASVELKKPEINLPSAIANNGSSVVGTWTAVSSDQDSYLVKNGVAGYIRRNYTFNKNGTYKDVIKTFSFFSDILLTQESGTYQINGNNITITPQKAVIESWSKKDNRDEWGKRKSSQNATMEKTTYQFSIEYNEYIKETQLILQTSQATKRDGPFHQNNKWFYKIPTHDYDLIKLPD